MAAERREVGVALRCCAAEAVVRVGVELAGQKHAQAQCLPRLRHPFDPRVCSQAQAQVLAQEPARSRRWPLVRATESSWRLLLVTRLQRVPDEDGQGDRMSILDVYINDASYWLVIVKSRAHCALGAVER